MLKTSPWPASSCQCGPSGIWGTVRAKENYSSELIPSSGISSSLDNSCIRVSSSSRGDATSSSSSFSQLISSSSATSISTNNSFIPVKSSWGGTAATSSSSCSRTGFSGGRMKQRFEGKLLNNAASSSSSRSSLGSAAWRKPKGEEKRVGWRDYAAAAASPFKMQVAVKKDLSSSLGDGNEEDATAAVKVEIEKMSNNSRKIDAKITIGVPLDVVWGILTDYEHLADFIPGLAESKCLEKRGSKCRLYQVGEQSLALGFTFKAKAVLDCEEKPTKMLDKNIMRRDIDFETVEGDFQVFRGTWRMEQQMDMTSPGDGLGKAAESAGEGAEEGKGEAVGGGSGEREEEASTLLSYILVVQPKAWLPVGLVEGRLTSEIKTNLTCIRDRSLELQLPGS